MTYLIIEVKSECPDSTTGSEAYGTDLHRLTDCITVLAYNVGRPSGHTTERSVECFPQTLSSSKRNQILALLSGFNSTMLSALCAVLACLPPARQAPFSGSYCLIIVAGYPATTE